MENEQECGDDYHFTLSDADAAALIEGLQRRVPRAMLEQCGYWAIKTWTHRNGAGPANGYNRYMTDEQFDALAAKYGVKVEEEET